MVLTIFKNLLKSEKSDAIKWIIDASNPRQELYFQSMLAVLISTVGLLFDNIVIIIGSMIIGPLMYPLLSLGLGISTQNWSLIWRSIQTVGMLAVLCVGAAVVMGSAFGWLSYEETYYFYKIRVSWETALVSFLGGSMGAFGLIKEKVSTEMSGVAISVALIPPLAAIGIGISSWNWGVTWNSSLTFLFSSLLITLGGWLIFWLSDFEKEKREVGEEVRESKLERKREEKRANGE